MIEAARVEMERRIATRPVPQRVGGIGKNENGAFILRQDWLWRCDVAWVNNGVIAGTDIDGNWRAFGYTQKELEELYARRSEFND
jgi:hypothetical protein